MKLILFVILSILSIFSNAFAAALLGAHFSDVNVGMPMIFLVPLLLIGLLTGIISFLIKKTQKLVLKPFLQLIYYLNLILMLTGIVALILVFFE